MLLAIDIGNTNIVIGVIYFSVIAITFFLNYKIMFREGLFDGVKRFLNPVLDKIKRFLKPIMDKIKPILDKVKSFFKRILNKITKKTENTNEKEVK